MDLSQPLIYDGYDPHARRSSRGCNCGTHSTESVMHGTTTEEEVIESSDSPTINSTPKTVPEAKAPAGSTTRMTPTPAPPIPKSAMRLNPATRKTMR
ncbi:MAG: hypothetical protein U0930_25785 [Pirellulales bacterium]